MTLAQLEQAAEDSAWDRLDIRGHLRDINGYGAFDHPYGRILIQHRKGPERRKGQRRYTLNGLTIPRQYAQALLG